MNISVITDKTPNLEKITGGGYAVTEVKVHIADNMPDIKKQEVVIHEILEVFLPGVCHEKIDELTCYLIDGLKQL